MEFYDELNKLMDAQQSFISEEGSTDIGAEIRGKISDTIDGSIKTVKRFIKEQLEKIDKSIKNDSFFNTIKYMQILKSQQEIVESLVDEETKTLITENGEKLDLHIS